MSINISKQKREDLIAKIKELRTFVSSAPQDENTGNLLSYLSDLEKDVNGKKYGLVFEEHREEIDEVLSTHTPVLTENEDLFINNGGNMNFLIEGDNLASLKLLEKTHKGKIDVIYIDPPYNTGSKDFIYDDTFINTDDLFKHSKWSSFISKRLIIAKKLLCRNGAIFISIDDNEQAPLKILCDEIFGADNYMGTIIQDKMNAKNDTINIQKNHEYILAYRKNPIYLNGTRVKPTLIHKTEKMRPALKEGNRYFYIGDAITTRGEGGTLNARPNLGYTVYFNPETNDKIGLPDYDIELAKTSNSIDEIYSHDSSLLSNGYFPILPPKVRGKLGCWTWSLDKFNTEKDNIIITGKKPNYAVKKRTFVSIDNIKEIDGRLFYVSIEKSNSRSIIQFSTNEGTNTLSQIMGERSNFNNPKNLEMLQYLLSLKPEHNLTILDFFAGSGTTGHAVIKLNAEDGGNRKFILCTNNENNICRDVTYKRIKRVIDKEGCSDSLKYYKVDYIPISERMYYEYAHELLAHIKELVELENSLNFTSNKEIAFVLTEDELEEFITNIDAFSSCKKLYMGHDLLPSEEQEFAISEREIEVNIIPDYYYRDLQED
ncbi:site-specific DNA-methyltransferase [Anaerostipes sp.]|uniref:site-specific DNA-methyltransferase n=1 Tax=Anaerostipes sp. TaxID=1872530 RepID=UPI0025BDAE9E|nr:site-specific DNA-methyltransferase [Anaerostipes sp.]MBS7008780.1 site-specific DNA-methyltransferase [Anaerostipes sp.]